MSTRSEILRELVLLTLGIGGLVVLTIAGALWLGGALSWISFAHGVLAVALVGAGLELFVVQRAVRTEHKRALNSVRRTDRTPGCTLALLLGLLVWGLLVCGAAIEWMTELR